MQLSRSQPRVQVQGIQLIIDSTIALFPSSSPFSDTRVQYIGETAKCTALLASALLSSPVKQAWIRRVAPWAPHLRDGGAGVWTASAAKGLGPRTPRKDLDRERRERHERYGCLSCLSRCKPRPYSKPLTPSRTSIRPFRSLHASLLRHSRPLVPIVFQVASIWRW